MTTSGDQKTPVAVIGATGLAGQQFVAALAAHPQFELSKLAASARSAGKSYREAITSDAGQLGWYADGPLPDSVGKIQVEEASQIDVSDMGVVFTALDSAPAREYEPIYAKTTPVISTASAFRYEDDVPLLLPGTNTEHIEMLAEQSKNRGWKGFVAPNPNCTTVGLAITLAPLHRAFGIERVHMVSMQSVSGAGRSPGVIALDVVDNIIPLIPGEEEKVAIETRKILGTREGGAIVPADFAISCTCTRVAVLEGHTEAVHVELSKPADEAAIRAAWTEFGSELCGGGYPSAPEKLIHIHDDPYRPQVRLDRDNGDGLTTTVGRLRKDDTTPNGWKYMLVSHNTKMGAATGCILLAEQLRASGVIGAS